MDFRNRTADLQVTVRHLSRPHHLDADLFSLTSYGTIGIRRKLCVYGLFWSVSATRSADNGPSPNHRVLAISLLGRPEDQSPVRSGAQRLLVMGRARIQKERATPRIARAFPLCVACRFACARSRRPDRRVTGAKPLQSTTHRHASRSISTSNGKICRPQGCPLESALIPN